MLVNIYGSKELFVSEYRSVLSEKLLSLPIQDVYNVDKEVRFKCAGTCGVVSELLQVRSLEYLKGRFGEESLEGCSFMLADIADSKRINRKIHDEHRQLSDSAPEADASVLVSCCALLSV